VKKGKKKKEEEEMGQGLLVGHFCTTLNLAVGRHYVIKLPLRDNIPKILF
jgi:hypothetical protein